MCELMAAIDDMVQADEQLKRYDITVAISVANEMARSNIIDQSKLDKRYRCPIKRRVSISTTINQRANSNISDQ